MPTYRNDTSQYITVGDYYFEPGTQHAVEEILEALPGGELLTKLSPAPYFNPVVAVHEVTFTTAGEQVNVPLNVAATASVEVLNVLECNLEIYLCGLANTPPIPVPAGGGIELKTERKVDRLILVPDGDGSCLVLEKRG